MATDAAPGKLELVRAFVNTLDLEDGADALESPAALGAWLAERSLAGGSRASREDLRRARLAREGLRALLLANNGLSTRKEAAAALTQAARRAGLALRFESGGIARIEPTGRGVDAALGRLLAIAAEAMLDGTWSRLKACRADDCRFAFYDHARNRSRTWCSMAVCGNRTKARLYRRRARGAGARDRLRRSSSGQRHPS